MTLQDLTDMLLRDPGATVPRDVAVIRAALMAYELGLEHGRQETHVVAHARAERDAEQRAHDRAVVQQRREEDEV